MNDLSLLFERSSFFHKRYHVEGNDFLNSGGPSNPGKLPNSMMAFEDDGIYVCQYGSSYLWTDLEDLKRYFEEYKIVFETLDYSD